MKGGKKTMSKTQKSHIKTLENWDVEYDKLLSNLVGKYRYIWKKIAEQFVKESGYKASPAFLKDRFKHISPYIAQNERKMTQKDDDKIVELVEKYQGDWNKITSEMPEFNPNRIKNRFYHKLRKQVGVL
mmetsp:Transcript_32423/g.29225  ORF Transcript_32423/g.29225 Transcript_32423/m.29225 type:complete len:129 (-) Transcript_32423:319-705(-)